MSGEKTEQPTAHKLREARKKGQVAISKDIVHVFSLTAGFFLLFTDSLSIVDRAHQLFSMPFDFLRAPQAFNNKSHLVWVLSEMAWLSFPLLFLVFLVAYLGVFCQIGPFINTQAVGVSFKRFDVVGNVKNMLSKKSFLQLLISLLKILVLGFVCFICIKGAMPSIVLLPTVGLLQASRMLIHLLALITTYSLFCFLLMAVLDYLVIKSHHIKSLMMSKQDIFQEYKSNEGDPFIKSQRKQRGRELLEQPPEEVLQNSSALVVNPTHIAVCLRFNPDEDPLPYILAIREGFEAKKYIGLARDMGVPIVRHVTFARAIYKVGLERCYIPSAQIRAAALIIRSVNEWLSKDSADREKTAQWELD